MRDKKSDAMSYEETREQLHRQMLSTVSHDLKTPLATIIGSLEISVRMSDKLSPEKKAMLINSALGEAYRLDNFITNILDMAKLEGGMVKPKTEQLELKSLLDDCLTRLGPRAKLHTIHIAPSDKSSFVRADPMLLGRAVGLVLDNAIKHAGKEATINVSYGSDNDGTFIYIRDNGPGIPAGKEQEIFSKYSRIARSDQQNAGTGLGLAICRQMMYMMSGTVKASNHPEGGAVFELRCP
ncbi:MAG: sensor histidine kinase [Rickettsiales bacterium]